MSLHLPATATLAEASALAASAEQTLMQGVGAGGERAPLGIDASALQSFDTSLLAVLLHARRLATGAGCAFEITGAPPKLGQLAQLYGVAELLGLGATAPPSSPPASSTADSGTA
jgi:phospholipid transport system transporter-binding protein